MKALSIFTFGRRVPSLVLAAALAGSLAGGCDKTETKAPDPNAAAPKPVAGAGGVAVVDIDQVAKALKWDEAIASDLAVAEDNAKRHLQSRFGDLQKLIEDRKKDMATTSRLTQQQRDDLMANRNLDKLPLTGEQKNELAIILQGANQYVQFGQQRAQQFYGERRAALINAYRDAIKPTVSNLAAATNMHVFTYQDGQMLYVEPAAELTTKVIAELQKKPVSPNIPPKKDFDIPKPELGPTGPTTAPSVAPAPTTKPR